MIVADNSIQVCTFQAAPPHIQESLRVALGAQRKALNEIFKRIGVGAALWVRENEGLRFSDGFNVEHQMPQLATCAEQSAISVAINVGYQDSCVGITVVAQRVQDMRNRIILPCDLCRPRLRQVAERSGVGDSFSVVCALPTYRRRGSKFLVTDLGTLLSDPRLRYSPDGIDIQSLLMVP